MLPAGYRVVQVKPKLGGLRLYLEDAAGRGNPAGWSRDALVRVSERTCEMCGDQTGTLRDDYWVLCDEHSAQHVRERGLVEPSGHEAVGPRAREALRLVRRRLMDEFGVGLLLLPGEHELLDLTDELLGGVPWYEEVWVRADADPSQMSKDTESWREAEAVLRRLRERDARKDRGPGAEGSLNSEDR